MPSPSEFPSDYKAKAIPRVRVVPKPRALPRQSGERRSARIALRALGHEAPMKRHNPHRGRQADGHRRRRSRCTGQGKHELAMQRYVAILQQNPGNVDALYYVAMLALQQGQIDEGLKVIGRAIAVGPPQARLHNLKGQAHLRLNQDDDALAGFRPRHRDRSGVRRRLRQPRHAACRDGPLGGGARRFRPGAGRCGRTTPRTTATGRARWPISAGSTRRWRDSRAPSR